MIDSKAEVRREYVNIVVYWGKGIFFVRPGFRWILNFFRLSLSFKYKTEFFLMRLMDESSNTFNKIILHREKLDEIEDVHANTTYIIIL